MPKLAPRHMVSNRTTEPKKGSGTDPVSSSEDSAIALLANPMVGVDPNNPPHMEIKALAGTGKTTVLIKGTMTAKGMPIDIDPSGQQLAIFDGLKMGKRERILFGAFGFDIAEYLKRQLSQYGLDRVGCTAKTMHGMGCGAVYKAFGKQEVDKYNDQRIACELLSADPRALRAAKPQFLSALKELCSLAKLNLIDPTEENLLKLGSYYEIEYGTQKNRQEVIALVPDVLAKSQNPNGTISFDDMVYLPNVLNLTIYKADVLLGDEVQDWNLAQQGIARKAADRIVLCGDENQSIFAFAGADAIAMQRQRERLGADLRGCVTLPLTITRRCSRAVVEEARQYVPEFEAHPSNSDGKVSEMLYPLQKRGDDYEKLPVHKTYLPHVQYGDMVLCAYNAPLISQCFKQISLGKTAYMLGRQIGDNLIALVDQLNASSTNELTAKLDDWTAKQIGIELSMRFPSDTKMASLRDKQECLMVFIKDCQTVQDVRDKITALFSDKNRVGIRHSSIHKAKGLEADNVFLIQTPEMKFKKFKAEWERKQWQNLQYVGITRAKHNLYYVT